MSNFDKTGIYAIINKINGKVYIGSTTKSFKSRWNGHKKELLYKKHINSHLQKAFDKYKASNFKFKIIQIIEKEDLDYIYEIETALIRYYDSANPNKGYNICKIGGSRRGVPMPKEWVENQKLLSLDDCFKIKELILEKTNESWSNKEIRIANLYKVSNVLIGDIKAGKHWSSKELGGSWREWNGTVDFGILSLNTCVKIKNSLIKDNSFYAKDKWIKIAKLYNTSDITVRRIYEGKHTYSKELGGNYKEWVKDKNTNQYKGNLTLEHFNSIKYELLKEYKKEKSFSKIYQNLSTKLGFSINTIKAIKTGKHKFSKEFGSFNDWIEMEEIK